MQLSYTAPDRHTPAEFLNALAAEFVAHTMETRWAGTGAHCGVAEYAATRHAQ